MRLCGYCRKEPGVEYLERGNPDHNRKVLASAGDVIDGKMQLAITESMAEISQRTRCDQVRIAAKKGTITALLITSIPLALQGLYKSYFQDKINTVWPEFCWHFATDSDLGIGIGGGVYSTITSTIFKAVACVYDPDKARMAAVTQHGLTLPISIETLAVIVAGVASVCLYQAYTNSQNQKNKEMGKAIVGEYCPAIDEVITPLQLISINRTVTPDESKEAIAIRNHMTAIVQQFQSTTTRGVTVKQEITHNTLNKWSRLNETCGEIQSRAKFPEMVIIQVNDNANNQNNQQEGAFHKTLRTGGKVFKRITQSSICDQAAAGMKKLFRWILSPPSPRALGQTLGVVAPDPDNGRKKV